MRKKPSSFASGSPIIIWFLGTLFFFADYIIRVSPSILTPQLMQFFHANAFTIGGFSAFFYYAYIGMQIPVGILVDKYSPKWLLVMAAVICAFSTFLFAHMDNLFIGFLSRFLMGFGASFAFVGTLKLISLWFKPERFAFLAGLTQAMGMIGAMVGQGPMAYLYQSAGWRNSLYGLGFLFILITLAMILFIKDNPTLPHTAQNPQQKVNVWESLALILKNPQNWLNCLFIGLIYAPSACFGEQWGASFLSLNQNVSMEIAGHETGMMFIGLAIGCPILGWISDRLQRRLVIMRISVFVCCLLLVLIIYFNPSSYMVLLFIYGFFNSGLVGSYALASEINPPHLTGMALGITNMASVLVGAIMIPIVGFLLDNLSTVVIKNGIPVFTIKAYQIAFLPLMIGFAIAFFMSFFLKETYCQRVPANEHLPPT